MYEGDLLDGWKRIYRPLCIVLGVLMLGAALFGIGILTISP